MFSHQLGFGTSWKMLTRDKGWIKPLLVIALFSWIPVVGQIVILGYGLEWARLTAWGVDAAPKQSKVDFGKMIATGGIAVLISIIVTVVLGAAGYLVFRTVFRSIINADGVGGILTSGMLSTVIGTFLNGGIAIVPFAVLAVLYLLVETFVLAAQLRATLYDGFAAGWRFDRLAQMVARDAGGFVHVCVIVAIWSAVSALLDKLVSVCAAMGVMSLGMMGMTLGMYGTQGISLVRSSVVPVLVVALVALLVLFAFQVVKVALQLVAINAMGQWFQRFDVSRWGVSSAPLPNGVPHKKAAAGSADAATGSADAGEPGAAHQATTPAADAAAPDADAGAGGRARDNAPKDETPSAAAEHEPWDGEADEDEAGPIKEDEPRKGPILLGPITTGDSTESPDSGPFDDQSIL